MNMDPRYYGCHNRPPTVEKRIVQDGRLDDSLAVKIVSIPNFSFGAACQYTKSGLGQDDTRCIGCKHKQDLTKGNP